MTQQTNPLPEQLPGRSRNNLFSRIRSWIQPPVFPEDDEQTRHAAMINTLLLAALALGILYGLTLPWSSASALPVVAFYFIIISMIVFGLVNIRRGHVTETIYIVTIIAWILTAVVSAFFGGVTSPVFATFTIVILVVGLLLGHRPAAIATVATISYGGVLLFLQDAGMISDFEGDQFSYLLRFSFVFLAATFLMYLTNQNFLVALKISDQARDESHKRVQELEEISVTLRDSAEKNSNELMRRSRYLDAAAQIAQNTITSSTLDGMLDLIVDQIAAKFGYYHVGIFLTDENSQWAVLRAASSDGGRQMIAREHRLGVGKQGIVGFVTGIGQPRITQDIGLDRIHSVTTELPETRSEMALPLKVRNEIIGALDIQDSIPGAFTDEDVTALQVLANQIALAVLNFRLMKDAQDRLDEVQRVYGEYSQRAWAETHRQKSLTAYRFSDGDLIPINNPQVKLEAENKLEIPILVRGNQIGVIEIAKEQALADWTSDEKELLETLSEQLGIALDSARLFNETQLRATTEKIIGDINSEIWESLEINSILKTTVERLQQSLELPEVSIKMTAPGTSQPTSGNGNPSDVR